MNRSLFLAILVMCSSAVVFSESNLSMVVPTIPVPTVEIQCAFCGEDCNGISPCPYPNCFAAIIDDTWFAGCEPKGYCETLTKNGEWVPDECICEECEMDKCNQEFLPGGSKELGKSGVNHVKAFLIPVVAILFFSLF